MNGSWNTTLGLREQPYLEFRLKHIVLEYFTNENKRPHPPFYTGLPDWASWATTGRSRLTRLRLVG
jgi:hypothetical protein